MATTKKKIKAEKEHRAESLNKLVALKMVEPSTVNANLV